VDHEMPVIALAPANELIDKLKSNIQEVRARGGDVIVFCDEQINLESITGMQVIKLTSVEKILSPIIYTIPLQLLAYHVAVCRGTDVDQPRNLAKSVTVE
jgi:glutamine---fructose-6-phosphate transaminase (isomerizing)